MADSGKSYEELAEENRALRAMLAQTGSAGPGDRRDEESVSRNEFRLKEAQRVAQIGSWERDLVNGTVTWSDQEYRILGLIPQEIEPTYETFLGFVHPDDRENVVQYAKEAIERRLPYDIEFRIIRKDGKERLLRSRAEIAYDETGAPVLMRGTGQDVTERRRAEAALKQSEEQFKTLIVNLRAAIYRCLNDRDWTVIYMSDFIEELSGYPASDFLNNRRTYASIIHPDDAGHVDETIQAAVNRHEAFVIEYRIVHKDGDIRHVYEKGVGVFGTGGKLKWLDGAIYDITEQMVAKEALAEYREHLEELIERRTRALQLEIATRIEAEERLTESKELLDALGHAQSQCIAEADPVKLFSDLLNSLLALTGSEYGFIARILRDKEGEPYLKSFATTNIAWDEATQRFYDEHAAEGLEFTNMKTLFGAVVTTGRPVIANDPANDPRAGGLPHGHPPLNAFLGIPFYSGERLVGMVGLSNRKEGYDQSMVDFLKSLTSTCANIIESYNNSLQQAHSERALKESEKRYRHLFENMNDSAFIADVETGIIVGTNRAAEVLLGCNRKEILGMHLSGLHPKSQNKQCLNILNDRVTKEAAVAYECEVLRKDGAVALVDISTSTFGLEGNRFVLCIFHDITERKQIEAEKQKSQKLESLGLLAGGIAHDFNNLLTAVMGNVSFSLHCLDKNDGIYDRLIEAEKATMRARDLTKQLITFARGGAPVVETISIKEIIEESTSFALRGSNVKCALEIPTETKFIEADPGQINQVLNNLIINANQSMPDGGIISVRTENVENRGGRKALSPHLKEGEYVKISISDQGAGIPRKHLHKIFDPYFTTKQSGSGLGLASVYSIIEKHNGYIYVNSETGVGSTFTLYLPSSDKKPLAAKQKRHNAAKGTQRILVMDDEEIILDLINEYLTHLGYTVELTTSGEEAIEAYEAAHKTQNPFDIVIMDLTIPGGMGGKEAIGLLLKIDPSAKAIVSSGYAQDPIMAQYKQFGFSGVVAKPYRLEELSAAIESISAK